MGANSDGFCHRSPAVCSAAGLQGKFLVVMPSFDFSKGKSGRGTMRFFWGENEFGEVCWCEKYLTGGFGKGNHSNRDAGYFNENKCGHDGS